MLPRRAQQASAVHQWCRDTDTRSIPYVDILYSSPKVERQRQPVLHPQVPCSLPKMERQRHSQSSVILTKSLVYQWLRSRDTLRVPFVDIFYSSPNGEEKETQCSICWHILQFADVGETETKCSICLHIPQFTNGGETETLCFICWHISQVPCSSPMVEAETLTVFYMLTYSAVHQ